MTTSKILDRLVSFAPAIIDRHTRIPQHCVFSTVVGVDVLDYFDVQARPLSVRVIVANQKYVTGLERDYSPPSIVAMGGHVLDTGDTTGEMDGPTMWRGHLVVWVPRGACILDLNIGAMNRPTKAIHLPSAAQFPFRPPAGSYSINGAQLKYVAHLDDVTWRDAADYTQVERRKIAVETIVRSIEAGKVVRTWRSCMF